MEDIPRRTNQPDKGKNPGAARKNDSEKLWASMSKFWVLAQPDSAIAERRRAKWNDKDEILFESIRCLVNPGHRRAGARLSSLSVVLPDYDPYEFVWTNFTCLVQQVVVQFFTDLGFTGFEAIPAKAQFAQTSRQPPRFWEFVVKGSAGLISPESGYSVLGICPGCGLIDDRSRISDPNKVVDLNKWDGSDFFRIQPISGCIFVTDRVVRALNQCSYEGWQAYSLQEMKPVFDIMVPEPRPRGRSHMN